MHPSLSGVLSKLPLEDVLLLASERRLRGALVLRPEGVEDLALSDVITLVDGKPGKVRTADPTETLGEVLVALGAIDTRTHADALRVMQSSAALLGDVLVRQKKIDRATLERALRAQITRKITQLFALPNATRYAFYADVDALAFFGAPELFPCDVAPIVFSGLREHPPIHADVVLDKLEGTPLRFKRGADLRVLPLTPDERDLVGLLRVSPMSVEQLEGAGVVSSRAARALAYALLVVDQLEPIGAILASKHPTPPQTPTGKALQKISSAPMVKIALRRISSSRIVLEEGGGDGGEDRAPSSTRRRIDGGVTPYQDDPRRTELRARAASLAEKKDHEVRGVGEHATEREIESAFVASASRWHPDALPGELADLRAECEAIWKRLVDAHASLIDAARRRRSNA